MGRAAARRAADHRAEVLDRRPARTAAAQGAQAGAPVVAGRLLLPAQAGQEAAALVRRQAEEGSSLSEKVHKEKNEAKKN